VPNSSNFQHLQLDIDSNNILWIALDVRDKPVNLLTPAVLEELARACLSARERQPRGLVLHSVKPAGFIAGADLEHLATLNTTEQITAFSQQGQAVCQQFADLPFPTLALIDGHCVGGGLELALALDYRIAADTPATRLGFPEVTLGIHPGFGGTVRSIATIGAVNALDIMLSGLLLPAQAALKIGLLDDCVAPQQLRSTAIHTLLQRPATAKPSFYLSALTPFAAVRKLLGLKLRKQIAAHTNPEHYPAPYALLDLWEKRGGTPKAMYLAEALSVAQLAVGNTAKNLLRVARLQKQQPTSPTDEWINHILMPYLLEGIRLHQQGIPARIIDAAARDFGMALGPLELADSIGLDTCQRIGEQLAKQDGLEIPLTLNHMTKAGKLGKQSGEGFYRYRHGNMMKSEPQEWHGNRDMLQTKLITPLINAARHCVEFGMVANTDTLDMGAISGLGFPAFRGGPLHYAQS
jgi:enoyl-CoA hydratase/carnithine racemase